MNDRHLAAKGLIAEAEKYDGIRAGVADIFKVLDGPSYKNAPKGKWVNLRKEKVITWIPDVRSILVLAMRHPEENPRLDWFERGNSEGNRHMMKISDELVQRMARTYKVNAQTLPYHVDRGGVFLKDAAVFSGMGIVGKNNLFIHRTWGPRVRLRAVLIQQRLPSPGPLTDFAPCDDCAMICRDSCPENAFKKGEYDRPACIEHLNTDQENALPSGNMDSKGKPILVTRWCRSCELACPVGK